MPLTQIQANTESDLVITLPNVESEIISTKVAALFAVRRIDANIHFVCHKEIERQWLINKLRSLQYSIYKLDRCGETNWIPSNNILDELWANIYEQLRFFGIGKREINLLLRDMKAYQRVEALLREGRSPTEVAIQDFYYLKTCDVRLARRLISLVTHHKYSKFITLAWNYYDLASEICDDLTDVWEDSFNYNCNRFTIKRRLFGENETRAEYSSFLHLIEAGARDLTKGAKESGILEINQICQWALRTIDTAKVILERCLKKPLAPVLAFEQKFISPFELNQIVKRYLDEPVPIIQTISNNQAT
ncbi:MAG: hypothetical protein M3247_07170 [Thermoproteota archaeon]|nr:hypothetical protein [Thermoproteota archaeon]